MNSRSKRSVYVFLLVFVVANYQIALSQQRSDRPLVLRGATVIDGLGGPPVPEAVIVIEGDKIKAVGGRGTSYPTDATVVDLSGKFVIPGFVDSHTHYQPWCGELYLNHGGTTVMAFMPMEMYGEEYYRDSQRSDVRTPRLFGYGREQLRLSPSMTREQVREEVQRWLRGKPDVGVLPASLSYNDRNKQVVQWAAEEIHQAGLMVFGHTENAPESIRVGHDGIEHIWGFAQALMSPKERDDYEKGKYLHWGTFLKDGPRMDQMIKEAVQRGAYLNPTLVYELGSLSSLARKHEMEIYNVYRNAALMTYYPRNLAEGLLLKFRAVRNFSTRYENLVLLSRISPEDWQEFKEAYRLSGEFVKRWVQEGGKIMAGTDDPQIGTCGLSIHMEMAMLVEVGLTPMQALQSTTLWGAEILTARRKVPTKPPVGLIAEGAFTDLVVLGANPLDNIDNTKKIERVMKGGQFVELGYHPDYSTSGPRKIRIVPAIPEAEISAISPHTVVEGNPELEMVVEGVGFIGNSVVRVDGVSVPTTFVSIRTLKAKIPADVVARAVPNRFIAFGPEQRVGVYGDRTVKITVFNAPPDGGTSNSVSLRVQAKWMAGEKR